MMTTEVHLNPGKLAKITAGNSPVRIDPPIPEERPVPPRILKQLRVDLRHQDLFLVMARLRDHPAKRIDEMLPRNWKAARTAEALAKAA